MTGQVGTHVNTSSESHQVTCETKMTGETKANQKTTYKSHEIECELEVTENVETYNGHHL